MDISKIIGRVKNILMAPKQEWPLIAAEKRGHAQVLLTWLLPLGLISGIAAIIGIGVVGISVGDIKITSMELGLRQALMQILSLLGGAYFTAYVVNFLAEKFASEKNLDQAFSLIAYAYTPACLGGIFTIIPSLAIVGSLIGLYSLYLLYTGLQPMMKTPQEKNTKYFVAILLCVIAVVIVISFLLGAILMRRM